MDDNSGSAWNNLPAAYSGNPYSLAGYNYNQPANSFFQNPTQGATGNAAEAAGSSDAVQPASANSALANKTDTGMAIGAGLGLLSALGAGNAHKYAGLAAAAQTRWSPWTKLGLGKMPEDTNALGKITALTAAGGALGQGTAGANLNNLFKPTVGYGTTQNGS